MSMGKLLVDRHFYAEKKNSTLIDYNNNKEF